MTTQPKFKPAIKLYLPAEDSKTKGQILRAARREGKSASAWLYDLVLRELARK